ncbi:DUF2878 domain-containing protein [Usitatibacter palustris]|uniref:DUF2878 domain-containing protein n=1 Tax=Usitatibacter palustris TaxID=2732487 RepID=A0A6M4H3T0_9PROT|nr:DUF2878 domain-containing protein [Usitatibacter palustris]QJR13738.1 hypothetical protein DSM104440_00528 [Usitatibacter palustris]
MALALNVVFFQLAWFACVLGAAARIPSLGLLVVAAVVTWHLARARQPRRELVMLGVAVLVGAAFETLLVQMGWVRYPEGALLEGLAPAWMVALWALFATTLNVSLRWLRARLGLAAVLGALGGPASYYAGSRLGAMELTALDAALVAIAIGWALLLPALLFAAQYFDGYAET